MINPTEHYQKHDNTSDAKPGGLVIGRRDGEIEVGAGLVPHAAVITSHDAEAIVAGREVGIKRLSAITRVLPVVIITFQFVAKTYLLRRDQTECRVVDLEIANQRRQPNLSAGVISFAVSDELFDVHRRRKFVEGKVAWIDDADAVPRQEPEFSVRGLGDQRAVVASDGKYSDSVGTVENRELDSSLRIRSPCV